MPNYPTQTPYNVGDLILNQRRVATLTNVEFDLDPDIEYLSGDQVFPFAAFLKDYKGTLKADCMIVDSTLMTSAIPGSTQTVGTAPKEFIETTTIGVTPVTYTVQQTPPITQDLGVVDGNGNSLLNHAAPITGQYSVVLSTGIYTFAASQGLVTVRYEAPQGATVGGIVSHINQAGQQITPLEARLYNVPAGLSLVMYAVVIEKFTASAKAKATGSYKLEARIIARASDGKTFGLGLAA